MQEMGGDVLRWLPRTQSLVLSLQLEQLSIPCRRGLACFGRDAGIIASKSGNFVLVPLDKERKCTLPKKWGVQGGFGKARSLWELTN